MKSRRTTRRTPRPGAGTEIIRGLTGLRDALAEGKSLPERFTMRTFRIRLEPGEWSARDVAELRDRLRVSQGVLATLLGASVKTVQSWEQGHRPPPMARRLLDLIDSDPKPWLRMLRDAADANRSAAA